MEFFKRKSADHAVKELVDGLSSALGPRLVSILLYGSKASGEFREGHSNVNVFILLADASAETLGLLSPAVLAWTKGGHPFPVFLPKNELQIYADSLPVEFLDMLEHHKVLFGPDPLEGLKVSRTNLRAQCTLEISVKLLKFRQAFLVSKGDAKKMRNVLTAFLPGVLTLYRAALRLEADVPPGPKILAAKEFAKRAGIDGDGLERLWDAHIRRQTDNVEDMADHVLTGLERAAVYLQQK